MIYRPGELCMPTHTAGGQNALANCSHTPWELGRGWVLPLHSVPACERRADCFPCAPRGGLGTTETGQRRVEEEPGVNPAHQTGHQTFINFRVSRCIWSSGVPGCSQHRPCLPKNPRSEPGSCATKQTKLEHGQSPPRHLRGVPAPNRGGCPKLAPGKLHFTLKYSGK